MLDTIVKKRAKVFAVILLLSVLLAAATALAASRFIDADKGGVIHIAWGISFKVPPNSLEEDTVISANMVIDRKRVCFDFGPDGTTFDPPAELIMTWPILTGLVRMGVCDLTLYGGDGSETEPIIGSSAVKYPIEHFSIYYFARR